MTTPEPTAAAWTVEFTVPDPKKAWHPNKTAFVIASTFRKALDFVEAQYPGCTVHAMHKRSQNLPILIAE